MNQFGFSEAILLSIVNVFNELEKVYRVRIFGSRALGCYKFGSDIDLAVEGQDLDISYILGIRLKLEDLMMPYRFDIVNFNDLDYSDKIKEHIEQVGVVIFERK